MSYHVHVVLDVILCTYNYIFPFKFPSYRASYTVRTVAVLMHLLHVCILSHNSIQSVSSCASDWTIGMPVVVTSLSTVLCSSNLSNVSLCHNR